MQFKAVGYFHPSTLLCFLWDHPDLSAELEVSLITQTYFKFVGLPFFFFFPQSEKKNNSSGKFVQHNASLNIFLLFTFFIFKSLKRINSKTISE